MRDKILAALAAKGLIVRDETDGRYLWTNKGQSVLVMSRAVGGRDSGFSPEDYVDGLALDLYYMFGPDASIIERASTITNNYYLTLASPAGDQVNQAFDLMKQVGGNR